MGEREDWGRESIGEEGSGRGMGEEKECWNERGMGKGEEWGREMNRGGR